MLAFALVRGRLSLHDFESLSLTEWNATARAISDREDYEYRLGWKHTQQLYFSALRPHLVGDPGADDVFPLPWEKKEARQSTTTEEDVQRILDLYKDTE